MIAIALLVLVMLAAVLLLIIINLILWQKQSSLQQRKMEEILHRLETVGQALEFQNRKLQEQAAASPQEAAEGIGISQSEQDATADDGKAADKKEETDSVQAENNSGTGIEEQRASDRMKPPEHEPDIKDIPDEEQKLPAASTYNIGKSGKIYTEEELELLIKE